MGALSKIFSFEITQTNKKPIFLCSIGHRKIGLIFFDNRESGHFDGFGVDFERGGILKVLLDGTLLCRTHQGIVIFFREFRGYLDFQLDGAYHTTPDGVTQGTLDNADAVGRQAALLAET
jgi:hypothetical protein